MRNAKIIDHQYISFLPPVEDQVLPYDVMDVGIVRVRYLGSITEGGMETDLHWPEKVEQEDL